MGIRERILDTDWGTRAEALCERRPNLCRNLRLAGIAFVALLMIIICVRQAFGAPVANLAMTCPEASAAGKSNCSGNVAFKVPAATDLVKDGSYTYSPWSGFTATATAQVCPSAIEPGAAICPVAIAIVAKNLVAQVAAPIPSTPASNTTGTVNLKWDAVTTGTLGEALTGVTYTVYRGASAGALARLATSSALTYQDVGVASGTWYYAVSATAAAVEGAKTNPNTVKIERIVPAIVIPGTPSNFTTTVTVTVP